ncbi:MAG: ferredoxin [Candidatus Aenigmarchaeota archaeon]|nr:ferredoxin [Candidatus Aenigmarchaeota archaeon]
MSRIDKDKCVGCGVCANICPEGIKMENGKARIKDENAECLKDAANACPQNAIILNGKNFNDNDENVNTTSGYNPGMGQGRGMGAGKGRGLGIGPRDGRGGGRGGGGRRKW